MKSIKLSAGLLAMSFIQLFFSSEIAGQSGKEADERASKNSLYASATYSNNMIYMGSNLSQNKPLFTGSLSYGLNERLYASVSVNDLIAFDPIIDFSVYSLSYCRNIGERFDISLDLSRYQVNGELTDTLFRSFFYGNFTAGVDWNILYTTISVGGLFADGSTAYFSLGNSRYFETGKAGRSKIYFSFNPFINILAGTLTKTVTADGTVIGVSQPYKSSKNGSGQHSSSNVTEFFSLMEIDFGIPVALNAGRFTVEIEPGYALPAYSDSDDTTPEGFTFFLNMGFSI